VRSAAALVLVVLGVLALVLPNLGAAPFERAEIYFLDVARAMVETGDWIVPRYQGEPFFDKPPLAYWLMAATFLGLGPGAAAARLVPALAAVLLVLVTAWLGSALFDRRTGLVGAVVLSTTLAFLTFARVAMSDMVLALLATLAVTLGRHAFSPRRPRVLIPAVGAALGLGFAAKGPIAVLVPGLALAVLLVLERRSRPSFGKGELVGGALAFAATGLLWYVLVYVRLGAEPLVYFFVRENLQRFAGEAYDVGRPPWFYLPAYAAEGLPWSPLLPLALWVLLRERGGDDPGRGSARFLAIWAGLVLVPLSLSRGKIDYYLLPLYPAFSLLVARVLVAVRWGRLERTWVRVAVAGLGGVLVLALLHPPAIPEGWLPGPGARAALGAVTALTILGAAAVAWRPRPAGVIAVLGGGTAALWLVLAGWFLPAFVSAQPNRAIVAAVSRERRYRPDLRLVTCQDPTRARRDVLFYTRLVTEERCDLWALAASRVPYLLLIGPDEDRSFRTIPHYRRVATYSCLPADVLTLDGLIGLSEPREIVLAANFDTTDPVAVRKRKRAYRKAIQRQRAAWLAAKRAENEQRRRSGAAARKDDAEAPAADEPGKERRPEGTR
jgi:4-amino-4-deoxy-L-arabinose transferase-like glycosyltransferase